MKKISTLLFVAVLAGCANPYAKFYHGLENGQSIPGYISPTQPLQIYSSNDFSKDIQGLQAKGFVVIGSAAFQGASNQDTERPLREQAAKVGAQVVLVSSKYSHTVSGAIPITTPTTSMAYTSGTATAYGSGGVVNAYGNSTTTMYGQQTSMVPYSIDRSEFGAVFMAKVKGRLGVIVTPLDDATRKRLETNQGVLVRIVVEGSPAYLADVLPGDVILQIGSDTVQSPEYFTKTLLVKYQGQATTLKLDRNGKSVEKNVTLNIN